MPAESPLPRKRGRPRKDNKQFNIRMPQQTRDALDRAASQAGYGNLGDWLTHMVQQNFWQKNQKKPRLTPKKAFARDVAEAKRLLDCLFESYDTHMFAISKDIEIYWSLHSLDSSYRRLIGFVQPKRWRL
jgi:hypothetical protein